MTELFDTLDAWNRHRRVLLVAGKSIGFVPTMGALHEGHMELIRRAKQDNDWVVVSVFLNPTQFNDPRDYQAYPRTLESDSEMASEAGADVIFAPRKEDLYPDDYRYRLTESELSRLMEGEHRPGHFDGVLTVVMKLFNLVRPARAYFGEKDYQQLKLIQGMVDAFFMDIEIVPIPTVRESDGLAMSSRNTRLSAEGRKRAPVFHDSLVENVSVEAVRADLVSQGITVEYIEDYKDRRLGAVVIDNVRLIDNVPIKNPV
ncbi:MAG: pantoate--beta-alanine ligase [Verrucomicrobiae bacterium]|nr:pantoate--beta-alanine ligase [Verrucomicrobiae bacterium]